MRNGLPQPRMVGSTAQPPRNNPRPNDYYDDYSRGNTNSPMMRSGYESPRFNGRQAPSNYPRSGRLDNASTPQLRYGDDRRGAGNRPERRYIRPPEDDDAYSSVSSRYDDSSSSISDRYDMERSRSGRERTRSRSRNDPRDRDRDRGDRDRERGERDKSRDRRRYNDKEYNSADRPREIDPTRPPSRPRRDVSKVKNDYSKSPMLSPSLQQHSKSQNSTDRYRNRQRLGSESKPNRQDSDFSDTSSRSSGRGDDRSIRSAQSNALSDLFGQFENEIDATLSETFSNSNSRDNSFSKYSSSREMDRREKEARERREREREAREREREAREREAREREAREREAREREAREREAREREAREREAREREAREREAREREAREREAREREAREREAREEEAREKERLREKERQERMRNNNTNSEYDLPRPQRVDSELPRPARNQSNFVDKSTPPTRPPRQESCEAVKTPPRSPRIDRSPTGVKRAPSSAKNNTHRGRLAPPKPIGAMPSDILEVTENDQDVDTLTISSKYRDHFIDHLISQNYTEPTPDDFITDEGYYMWEENTDKRPFVDVLAQLVDHRFSKEWMDEQNRKMEERKKAQQPTMARQESTVEYNLVIKVVSARGIIAKEGKTRNPYCEVNYDGSTFHTEKCENTTEPYWNQHLELKAKDLTDKITLKVWDGKKGKGKIWKKESNDEFLGMVTISIAEIIKMTYQSGYVSQWYQLGKRADKKDKHVGGQILIEATEGKNSDIMNFL